MAVNDTNVFDQENAPKAAPQTQQAQPAGKTFSFNHLNSFTSRIGNRKGNPEYVLKLKNKLEEAIKSNIYQSLKFNVISLGRDNGVAIDMLIVSTQNTAVKSEATYYTLLLEATSEPLVQKTVNVNVGFTNKSVEIFRTTSDRFNRQSQEIIEKALQPYYPTAKLVSAGALIVPADFDVEDTTDASNLAIWSYFVPGSVAVESTGAQPLMNLVDAQKDTALTLTPSFDPAVVNDIVGNPIRSDIKLRLSASPLSNSQSVTALDESVQTIFDVDAYVDLVYSPQQLDPSQMNPYQYAMLQQTQPKLPKYIPRIIITSINSAYALTTDFQLLGLAQIAAMYQAGAIFQPFLKRNTLGSATKGKDLRDPGILNIEMNLANSPTPEPVDTNAADFDDAANIQYLTQCISVDRVMTSIDIPAAGMNSGIWAIFLEAAKGNVAAQQYLTKVADTLTNGNYSRLNPKNVPLVTSGVETIHGGYYVNADGVKRDARDIDTLAVMNLHPNDPQMAANWTDTFNNTDVPEEIRLSDRKKIIENCAQVKFTDKIYRVTFNFEALVALVGGCAGAGLDINSQMRIGIETNQQRATANYGAGAVGNISAVGQSIFQTRTQAFGNFNNQYAPQATTRW